LQLDDTNDAVLSMSKVQRKHADGFRQAEYPCTDRVTSNKVS